MRKLKLNSRGSALWTFLALGLAIALIDQSSKLYVLSRFTEGVENSILPFLSFTLAFNRGAAFGFLNDAGGWQLIMFSSIAFLVVAYLVFHIWQEVWQAKIIVCSYGFIAGGAVGNVIDRIYLGMVVDFIDVHFSGWHFWIFNIADIALSIGVGLLILSVFFEWRANRQSTKVR
jgi:signal peptidase II